jgi:outer membrane protein TolC
VQHYNAMQVGAFTVLEARKAQLHDEREHVQVRRDALFARLDLERLLAGGLPAAAFTPSPSPAIDVVPDPSVRLPARTAP